MADDVEPGTVEQASQAFTQQDVVVGEHDPECAPVLRRFGGLWWCPHTPIIDHEHQAVSLPLAPRTSYLLAVMAVG